MKPFNLEAALAGAPVCTRDGREVTQLHKFDGVTYGLVGVIQGQLYTWSVDGVADTGSCRDLCMAPVKKTGWVARYAYMNIGGAYVAGTIYDTEEEVKLGESEAISYHMIEWQE